MSVKPPSASPRFAVALLPGHGEHGVPASQLIVSRAAAAVTAMARRLRVAGGVSLLRAARLPQPPAAMRGIARVSSCHRQCLGQKRGMSGEA